MDARFALFVSVALAVSAASAHAQAGPPMMRSARAMGAVGRDRVECRLTEPMHARPRRSYYLPWADGRQLLEVPAEVAAMEVATPELLDVPEHELVEPTIPVIPTDSFLADMMYRVRPVDGWTWVNLGVGTAGLGIAAAFFRAAGAQATGLSLLQPRASAADPSTAGDPLAIIGNYSLNYDNLGSLALQTGLGTVSSTVFRLIYAPRDNRTVRYMRTFVTEYQGGWLFGFQGVMF